jgi:hypothetical protein
METIENTTTNRPTWTSDPGGKVHRARIGRRDVRIVKQNTAAGGPRWKAYAKSQVGPERVVAKGESLRAAKADAEASR